MENVTILTHSPPTCSTLVGSVEHVTYFNQETGQCVFKFKTESLPDAISVSCRRAWLYPGLQITIDLPQARMENGLYRVHQLQVQPPQNERSLRKFLKSEAMPGIGPKLAKVLAKAFPINFFFMVENHPEQLMDVEGIGPKKQKQIIEAWGEFKKKAEFSAFLFAQDFPLSWMELLWPAHGADSLQYLKSSPYDAATRYHLDFEKIDRFALRQGLPMDSAERLRAGIKCTLWELFKEGHCGYPEEEALGLVIKKLESSREVIEEILEMEIIKGEIVVETIQQHSCLYLKEVWELEQRVAKRLLKFRSQEAPFGWFNSYKVLSWAQSILNIQLAPLQQEAIETALSSSLTVITGGPGTGKTTLIRSLVTILQTQFAQFALCSPTGRAAQRLKEATNMPAQTIHRLLKYDGATGRFQYNKNDPLNVDLVLVDEASMVDMALMDDLLDALPEQCALILVGDADQIPSVGAGNVLQSLISSPYFKVVCLEDVYRQSQNSTIKENAKLINEGKMPLARQSGDFQYIPVQGKDQVNSVLQHLLQETIPHQCGITDMENLQILVPKNQGTFGTQMLNETLQQNMNRYRALQSLQYSTIDFGQDIRKGDKVMVTKNDYKKDVFNGDIGFVDCIDYQQQFLEVEFPDDRRVRFEFPELDRLTLAYAISIHKAQGSEYKAVIVVLTEEHLPMAQRHLIYTAITRGKDHVFLVAEPVALQTALQRVEKRWEKLTELLTQ